MTYASGMQRDIAIVDEVTYGTTPATPSFTLMRVVEGSGVNASKVAEVVRQLSAHKNPVDFVQLGQDAAGSYELVPSYGGAFETMLLAAIHKSSFSTNTAWNGTDKLSKTFEEKITGTAANYLRFTGAEVEQLTLSMKAREIVKATANIQAKAAAISTSAISGATYAAVNTEEVYTGLMASNLAVLGLGTVPAVTGLSVSIKHALSAINTLGNLTRSGTVFDDIEVTGSVETVFEDKAAYDLFLNHSNGSLVFTIGSVTAKKYTVTLPKVFFSEGSFTQAGKGPVAANFNFQAVYDGTNGTIKIDKAVA